MFGLFNLTKVKVENTKFKSINQVYYLRKKKLKTLIEILIRKEKWNIVFYFDDLTKKDVDFICETINISSKYNKNELNENAQDLNIYFR